MTIKTKFNIVLLLIFSLALILRFYKISEVPICMNWDEASFAYNAYSILKTGKDEYGGYLPLQFKSVGDYKFPFFVYSLVPIIKIFDLDVFSIRFLPSLTGSLSVLVFYGISYLISRSRTVALISAFFLAISPWHLQFTRAGADVGYASFFTFTGIYLFLRAVNNKKASFLPSFLFFSASIYSYFTERIFAPLILGALTLLNIKVVKKRQALFAKNLLVFILILFPAIYLIFSSGHQEKFLKTTIFGFVRLESYVQKLLLEDRSGISFSVFHSEFLEKSLVIANHYLNHFSPSFLFLEGPYRDPRQYIYQMGMMYIYDLPLIVIGAIAVFKKRKEQNLKFLLLWLLIAPIPSAITRDPVHARRSFNMLYPLLILSAMGLDKLVKTKKIVVTMGLPIFVFAIIFYFQSYYIFTPLRTYKGPAGWQCGYKELVETTQKYKNKYEKIIIDTSYQGPYIFFLFYEQYDPARYQPQANLFQESPDVLGEGVGYDSYVFRPIYWPEDRLIEKTLFIGPPERLPTKDISEDEARIVDTVYFPNGEIAFLLVETLWTIN